MNSCCRVGVTCNFYWFSFFFFKDCLFIFRERNQLRYLPFTDSLPRWTQWPMLGEAEVRNRSFTEQGHPHGEHWSKNLSHLLLPSQPLTGSWITSWAAGAPTKPLIWDAVVISNSTCGFPSRAKLNDSADLTWLMGQTFPNLDILLITMELKNTDSSQRTEFRTVRPVAEETPLLTSAIVHIRDGHLQGPGPYWRNWWLRYFCPVFLDLDFLTLAPW